MLLSSYAWFLRLLPFPSPHELDHLVEMALVVAMPHRPHEHCATGVPLAPHRTNSHHLGSPPYRANTHEISE